MNLRAELSRILAPIRRHLSTMVGRALLSALDDTKALQVVKVRTGPDEVLDGVERIQNYGFTSVPEAGGEVVLVCVGGNPGQAMAIVIDDSRTRKKNLAAGDVCVYNGKTGDYVLLSADGVEIHSANIKLSDATILKALITEDLVAIFNQHVHATAGTGTPSPPVVQIAPGTAVTSKTKAG